MSGASQVIGRIRSALGWATADREAEAKGKLQELDATDDSPGDSTDADSEQVLQQAELDVRGDHGDLAPGVERDARPSQQPSVGG